MKKIIAIIGISILMFSCDVVQQVTGAFQLTQCKYDFRSISGLALAGINMQNVNSLSSLNPINLATLMAAFTTKEGSLPLNFILNLDVTNSGKQAALLNGLGYILEIDGYEMTTGSLNQKLQIDGGSKAILPIQMSFDLKKALSGESLSSIKNLAFNFAGIGNESSNVTFRLKPTFTVGNQVVSSPNYIPVSFKLN
jgi:LEA14-like dessication related protein